MVHARKLYGAAGFVQVAAIALAISSTAGAQEMRLATHSVPAISTPAKATGPTVDDAKRLFEEGRWKDARKTYDEVAARAEAEGEYVPAALEGRAQLQYIGDDVRGAARTFAQLAGIASKYGDPEKELTASF